jgi:hypothetical protein
MVFAVLEKDSGKAALSRMVNVGCGTVSRWEKRMLDMSNTAVAESCLASIRPLCSGRITWQGPKLNPPSNTKSQS